MFDLVVGSNCLIFLIVSKGVVCYCQGFRQTNFLKLWKFDKEYN